MKNIRLQAQKVQDMLTRKTSSGRYLPVVDGLRFFAIFPVVVHHLSERIKRTNFEGKNLIVEGADEWFYNSLPSGPLGVELFFVISGFVISLPLLSRWYNDDEINFKFGQYFKRRLTRLEPPYIVVMVTSFLFLLLLGSSKQIGLTEGTRSFQGQGVSLWESFLASLVYLHGILFQSYPRLNPPAWSLEIEFQFYVIAPFLILLATKLVGKSSKKAGLIALIFILVVLGIKLGFFYLFPKFLHKYLISRYIEFFILGFLACILYLKKTHENQLLIKYASGLFLLGIAIAYFGDMSIIKGNPPYVNRLWLLIKLIGFLLIFVTAFSGGIGKKITSNKWIAIVGGMCYTIYLIHLIFFQVAVKLLSNLYSSGSLIMDLVVYLVVLLPILMFSSAVFFVMIEKPCMDPMWINKLLKKRNSN